MGRGISDSTRIGLRIKGIVQGVGFRPFIYRHALKYQLDGFVLNDSEGVWVELQGPAAAIDQFVTTLAAAAPSASRLDSVSTTVLPVDTTLTNFTIRESQAGLQRQTLISPDLAICEDCKRDITAKDNRRYGYAFTNCTNCGPRFSIVQDIPYDRPLTTMRDFIMCEQCQREYTDPMDRRFHAQPNACASCGPQYALYATQTQEWIAGENPLALARQYLLAGKIVAIKGLGGYHLACDARNQQAVSCLRARKVREDKPLAVMTKTLSGAKYVAQVGEAEAQLLTSPMAPIVVLPKAPGYDLAEAVAPHNAYIGIMLAYTPAHYLLLQQGDCWVMTSANLSDEPIVYRDEEARSRLSPLADYILLHNRVINTRVDDSVVTTIAGDIQFLRRSRGYAPAPIKLASANIEVPDILGCGGELKATFCVVKGSQAFMSQHIGDLENQSTFTAYKTSIDLYKRLFSAEPQLLVRDYHPEYLSGKYAKEQGLPLTEVQHHHAHIASVLAEHQLEGPVIGVALDGTGWGNDGTIWGGEFLIADLSGFERRGHFAYQLLPGGTKAIREPWRLAVWTAYQLYGEDWQARYPELVQPGSELLLQATKARLNAPVTSSAGRVFDTVAALLGVCYRINYEGQAAIELERLACGHEGELLPYTIRREHDGYCLDFMPLYRALGELNHCEKGYLAQSFHLTMAKAIAEMVNLLSQDTGLIQIACSGGVCQNRTLMELLVQELSGNYTVYLNRQVPPNDGGIALGQVAVAHCRYLRDKH